MEWVSIDNETCDRCNICAQSLPRCFQEGDDAIKVLTNQFVCVLCGHCVAICPTEAIHHNGMNMDNFQDKSPEQLISTETLTQFIRERRSYRKFNGKEIPRPDLEKLADIVRYAPTGGNQQSVELIMVIKQDRIQALTTLVIEASAKSAAEDRKKAETMKANGTGTEAEIQQLEGGAMFREMMVASRKAGMDPIFYNASAVAILHTPMNTITPKDNCVIASTTMGLMGRTLGLEFTYIAMFENTANNSPEILASLNIPVINKIQSVIAIGYPSYQFLKTVDRNRANIRWE